MSPTRSSVWAHAALAAALAGAGQFAPALGSRLKASAGGAAEDARFQRAAPPAAFLPAALPPLQGRRPAGATASAPVLFHLCPPLPPRRRSAVAAVLSPNDGPAPAPAPRRRGAWRFWRALGLGALALRRDSPVGRTGGEELASRLLPGVPPSLVVPRPLDIAPRPRLVRALRRRLRDLFRLPWGQRGPPPPEWLDRLNEHLDSAELEGRGATGVVYRGRLRSSGREVAVKVVEADCPFRRRAAMMELAALAQASGGDIVQLYAAAVSGDMNRTGSIFLFMEPASATLHNAMAVYGIPKAHKIRMLVEILRGLRRLEEAGFVHSDVKSNNILVFGDPMEEGLHAKLSDFGHARLLSELRPAKNAALIGAPGYIAPEAWMGRGWQGKVDVWSAGIVAFELFVGQFPSSLRLHEPNGSSVPLEQHPFREYVPKHFKIRQDSRFQEFREEDRELASFIESMLRKCVWRRPSIRDALARAQRLATSRGIPCPEQPIDTGFEEVVEEIMWRARDCRPQKKDAQ